MTGSQLENCKTLSIVYGHSEHGQDLYVFHRQLLDGDVDVTGG